MKKDTTGKNYSLSQGSKYCMYCLVFNNIRSTENCAEHEPMSSRMLNAISSFDTPLKNQIYPVISMHKSFK